jgi:hypothetical protein
MLSCISSQALWGQRPAQAYLVDETAAQSVFALAARSVVSINDYKVQGGGELLEGIGTGFVWDQYGHSELLRFGENEFLHTIGHLHSGTARSMCVQPADSIPPVIGGQRRVSLAMVVATSQMLQQQLSSFMAGRRLPWPLFGGSCSANFSHQHVSTETCTQL